MKKIISFILVFVLIFSVGMTSSAANDERNKESYRYSLLDGTIVEYYLDNPCPYMYQFSDGTFIEYMLDEDGLPYHYVNGEKYIILIPLPHLLVTDEELLAIIQAGLPENPEDCFSNPVSTYAAPTSYVDISSMANSIKSASYSDAVTFNTEILYTPVFKLNRGCASILFETTNIDAGLFSSKRINLVYSAYDPYFDKWSSIMLPRQNCENRKAHFTISPSANPYGKFSFNKYDDDVNGFTYTVWTEVTSN